MKINDENKIAVIKLYNTKRITIKCKFIVYKIFKTVRALVDRRV